MILATILACLLILFWTPNKITFLLSGTNLEANVPGITSLTPAHLLPSIAVRADFAPGITRISAHVFPCIFKWHHLPNDQLCTLVGDQEGTIALALFAHIGQPLLDELVFNPVILLHNATIVEPPVETFELTMSIAPPTIKRLISHTIALRIAQSH